MSKLKRLSLAPRKKPEEDPDSPYTIKGLNKITQTTCISACGFSLDLVKFQQSDFLQREFTGNYHPCIQHAYNEFAYSTEESIRSNMEPFLHFAKFMKHRGGFLWFDKITPDVIHEFTGVLKPSGLFLNNNGLMRIWTTSISTKASFELISSFTDCPKLRLEAVQYLLSNTDVYSAIYRGGELFSIFKAAMNWQQGSSNLKHLSFTGGQRFSTELIREFESLGYRTITPGNYHLLCQQVSHLKMHFYHFGESKLQLLYRTISEENYALVIIDERKMCTFHCL